MSDFIAHWGQSAIRVSLLLIVGTLLVLLCIRVARGGIAASSRSLLWFVVLALGLCWFTIPIEQPAWWPSWQTSSSGISDAREAEPGRELPLEGEANLAFDSHGEFPPGWPSDGFDPLPEEELPADAGGEVFASSVIRDANRREEGVTATDEVAVPESAGGTAIIIRALFAIWLAAVVILVALFAFQHLTLLRRLRRSATPGSPGLRYLHQELSKRTATRSRLLVSAECTTPMLVGLVRPRIWLPNWIEDLAGDSQSAVLAHEMAHIARRDAWTTLIAVASNIACWFHPLAWLSRSRMHAAREQAADAWAVTRAGCTAVSYAKALVDVAERMPTRSPLTMPAMSIARSELHDRVSRVLDADSVRDGRWLVLLTVAILSTVSIVSAGREPDGTRRETPADGPPSSDVDTPAVAATTTDDISTPATEGVDLYGDPLPEGATARLGTVRYRAGSIGWFLDDSRTYLSFDRIPLGEERFVWTDLTTGQIIREAALPPTFRSNSYSRRLRAVTNDRSLAAFSHVESLEGEEGEHDAKYVMTFVDIARGEIRAQGSYVWDQGPQYAMPIGAAFTSDGTKLIAAHQAFVSVWDVATGEVEQAVDIEQPDMEQVVLSPDDRWAFVTRPYVTYRWEWQTDGEATMVDELRDARALDITPDGSTIVAVIGGNRESDDTIRAFDIESMELRWESPLAFGAECWSWDGDVIDINADGSLAAIATRQHPNPDGQVQFFDINTGELVNVLSYLSEIQHVDFSPDDNWLTGIVKNSGPLVVWDLETGDQIGEEFVGPLQSFMGRMVVSPDGIQILTGGWNGEVTIWDAETGAILREFKHSHGMNAGLAFSPNGALVASAAGDGVAIWDVQTGDRLATHPSNGSVKQLGAVGFSADSSRLMCFGSDCNLRAYDVASGQMLFEHDIRIDLPLSPFGDDPDLNMRAAADFAHGGRTLVVIVEDTVFTFDVETGAETGSFAHNDQNFGNLLKKLAISPDGTQLALRSVEPAPGSAPNDEFFKSYEIRNLATGEIESAIPMWGYDGEPAISADGTKLVAVSQREGVSVYDIASGELLAHLDPRQDIQDSAAFVLGGDRIVVSGFDTNVLVWDWRQFLVAPEDQR